MLLCDVQFDIYIYKYIFLLHRISTCLDLLLVIIKNNRVSIGIFKKMVFWSVAFQFVGDGLDVLSIILVQF